MGIQRENGYSASVEAYLVVDDTRVRLAKTNGCTFTLAEPCELLPGTVGDLVVIIDDEEQSKAVLLPNGSALGQTIVDYIVTAPF
jgi:hypothetical protein